MSVRYNQKWHDCVRRADSQESGAGDVYNMWIVGRLQRVGKIETEVITWAVAGNKPPSRKPSDKANRAAAKLVRPSEALTYDPP